MQTTAREIYNDKPLAMTLEIVQTLFNILILKFERDLVYIELPCFMKPDESVFFNFFL